MRAKDSIPVTYNVRITYKDPAMMDFERRLPAYLAAFRPRQAERPAGKGPSARLPQRRSRNGWNLPRNDRGRTN